MCGSLIRGRPRRIYVEGSELIVCEKCYTKYVTKNSSSSFDLPFRFRVTHIQQTVVASRYSTSSSYRGVSSSPQVSRGNIGYLPSSLKSNRTGRTVSREVEEYEVVEDYSVRIRRARERLGWSRKVLAEKVRVSENVIRRIEDGSLMPTIDLARRLEKVLGIKLLEPVVDEYYESSTSKRRYEELTLGDIAEIRED